MTDTEKGQALEALKESLIAALAYFGSLGTWTAAEAAAEARASIETYERCVREDERAKMWRHGGRA